MKALVTGSTQGIGLAIAEALVKKNYEVIVHCSRDIEKAEKVRRQIGAAGAVVCDLGEADEVAALYGKTGAVDCLILNASVQYKEKWTEITPETLDNQINVNIKSTLRLMQDYYPLYTARTSNVIPKIFNLTTFFVCTQEYFAYWRMLRSGFRNKFRSHIDILYV
jgi:NAD(P)-dependent dehydrogenase (short-subunit alcohol dehydrogenase family)